MDRIVAVIEARMGSSRLPGKSMRPLAGVPLVQRVAERARHASVLDEVVIATSTSPKDDVLATHMQNIGFSVYRGSEDDVLARILGAAEAHTATIHVQCWGDCPFLEPAEIERVVSALLDSKADLAANNLEKNRRLPYGLDVIAFRVSALQKAERATRDHPYHREHGTTYIYQNPDVFQLRSLETPADLHYPDFNVTINTEDDYHFVATLYDQLLRANPLFDIRDVIALIRSQPTLLHHANARALVEPR